MPGISVHNQRNPHFDQGSDRMYPANEMFLKCRGGKPRKYTSNNIIRWDAVF